MNLPNKITLSRIFFVPIFLFFVIPIPNWVVESSLLSFFHNELVTMNNFVLHYGNYIGVSIFLIAASTDGIDGYIARKRRQVTRFGKFLDPIADKLLITAALIALAERHDISGWAAMIIISREFIVTGFRLIAAGEGIVISANNSGKIKTIVQIIAIVVTLLRNYPFSLFTNFEVDRILMLAAVVITIYSGYTYIASNKKVLKTSE